MTGEWEGVWAGARWRAADDRLVLDAFARVPDLLALRLRQAGFGLPSGSYGARWEAAWTPERAALVLALVGEIATDAALPTGGARDAALRAVRQQIRRLEQGPLNPTDPDWGYDVIRLLAAGQTAEELAAAWQARTRQAQILVAHLRERYRVLAGVALEDAAVETGDTRAETEEAPEPPVELARKLAESCGAGGGMTVLTTGGGLTLPRLLRIRGALVVAVETGLAERLRQVGCCRVAEGDFLAHAKTGYEGAALVCPPGQEAAYLPHAYRALAPYGRLAAVVQAGIFREASNAAAEFCFWLEDIEAVQTDAPGLAYPARLVVAVRGEDIAP